MREQYAARMFEIRCGFEADGDGVKAASTRAVLVDTLLQQLWAAEAASDTTLAGRVTVVALGGYGRRELFPYSDIDVLFCVANGEAPKQAIQLVTQALWDCGLRAAPVTRLLSDCGRFEAGNVEFALALLDRRWIAGDKALYNKLDEKSSAKMLAKEAKPLGAALMELTRTRHARYGNTLFHLEPNIKECPGGLRDAHVCGWLRRLNAKPQPDDAAEEFEQAESFLAALRCFLHWRSERDDNTLDWSAQDAAAAKGIGIGGKQSVSAEHWMRAYFRHARAVERRLVREAGDSLRPQTEARRGRVTLSAGVKSKNGSLSLQAAGEPVKPGLDSTNDAANDPDTVLGIFVAMATLGQRLTVETEQRIADAVPRLSSSMEEGPALWHRMSAVLTGEFAGAALRAMHATGVLDLIVPEFHGIDALVIRDAYHRYTVDEHTFVLIDTLHSLEAAATKDAPEWRVKFGAMLRELQSPGLLYLAALLHDTGKARASGEHAVESARLAQAVLERWEMDAYDAKLVVRLIQTHLEMSSALRRDIFDTETVRAFAAKVQTHEALRMLTLFTYADIQAVHPDALTPWKAENLWRLTMRAANQMDRAVDEERVHVGARDERVQRVLALEPGRHEAVKVFLEGFPERYLATRSSEQIHKQFLMAEHFAQQSLQMVLHYGVSTSELTLVTRDRPHLFAGMAGALAAWGMNVVTADAFANAAGVVVDSFRFTDTFRTLELNMEERERFVSSVRDLVTGAASLEAMLAGRRRAKRRAPRIVVETRIDFDSEIASGSTLLQVVAQDVPGLLSAISRTLSDLGCNVEVALIDTEGETAIDVFYLTRNGARLSADQETELGVALRAAIEANAK